MMLLQFVTRQRCTKFSHKYSVLFSLSFKLMRCLGYYRLSFTFPASTVSLLHVTWLTQFKDYRHDDHMLQCPVSRLHLSISSSVSDARILLMNKLFCSFSLACASYNLDAWHCLFHSWFFSLFFASFFSSMTLTCFLGLPLLLVSSIHPSHFILLLKSTNKNK